MNRAVADCRKSLDAKEKTAQKHINGRLVGGINQRFRARLAFQSDIFENFIEPHIR
jgi:hypothetical protein